MIEKDYSYGSFLKSIKSRTQQILTRNDLREMCESVEAANTLTDSKTVLDINQNEQRIPKAQINYTIETKSTEALSSNF